MHPDIISTSIWDEPGNVETLRTLHAEGKSAAQIAAILGQGVTRAAVIGKATRLGLQLHGKHVAVPKNTDHGNKGQSTAKGIVARAETRQRAIALATVQHSRSAPFRAGYLPPEDGVDVTRLISFSDRRIGHECSWIPGDPTDGAMCCGKPVRPGTEWCESHWARVYGGRHD